MTLRLKRLKRLKRRHRQLDADGLPALGGRQRLFDATLRLAAKTRSIHALGLREIGREAGLNPNTFYRHFRDLDELAHALVDDIGTELRRELRERRLRATAGEDAAAQTVDYVFDFALRRPEAISVAVREIHGASPSLRLALRKLIDGIASDMAEDARTMKLTPGLDAISLHRLCAIVVEHIFYRCLDVIEQPRQRAQLLREAVEFITMLFAGAMLRTSLTPGKTKP